ncbi:MAG TPA: hypothetical protein VK580_00670 [Steroidobacteraceae bacterium]|nr:hypothetical protein [Steroidobacteraceae bacterium]
MHQSRTRIANCALVVFLLALGLCLPALRTPAADSPPATSPERNGQHDFDFLFGRWKVHLKRKVPGTDRWTPNCLGESASVKGSALPARLEELARDVYGRRMYEIMRYWDDDLPDWDAEDRDFAAV